MSKNDFKDIKKNSLGILNELRKWAIIVLVFLIFYVLLIDLSPIVRDFANKHTMISDFLQSIKSLFINIIPLVIISIFIDPILKYIKNIDLIVREKENLIYLDEKFSSLEELFNKNSSSNTSKEIYKKYYSYLDTEWNILLQDASILDICMLYTGKTWRTKNEVIFRDFINQGGTINLYIPKIHSELSNRFSENSKLKKDIEDRIIQTSKFFLNISNESTSGEIVIKQINSGFNYMFARISKLNHKKLFLLSPYQNNIETTNSPVIIFDENEAPQELINFINSEITFLQSGQILPNLEKEKFIVWDTTKNRVFISNSLTCNLGCKFCYVDSIAKNKYEHNDGKIARQIYADIRNDKRYSTGNDGTTIMLGGFSDPLSPTNIDNTLKLIDLFSTTNNNIHISTRIGFGNYLNMNLGFKSNVVINYSISCISDSSLEYNNQMDRFNEMKILSSQGYNVALYIRPVIQDLTIRDIDEIIDLAKISGISVITVGGIYVDNRILNKLKQLKINLDNKSQIKKQFVLDDKFVLRKLNIPDLQIITRKLKDANFLVFQNSDERIKYFNDLKSKNT